MLEIFLTIHHYPFEFFACLLLAFIPVIIWMRIFLAKHPKKKSQVGLTFFAGMISAVLVLGYQSLWGDGPFNLVFFKFEAVNFQENIREMVHSSFLASFFIFMSVGLMEEVSKHYVTVKADHDVFESVDDVIEFSIVAALGFAFLENIGYFLMVLQNSPDNLFSNFLMRSVFVVFIHILCSAIYGAYYGVGFFAKPYMIERMQEGQKFAIANFFHKMFHFRKTEVFKERMMMEGLVLASFIHGLYDFLLDIDTLFMGKPLYVFVLPAYLIGGFWFLSYLLNKKENLQRFGHIAVKESFIIDETEEEVREKLFAPKTPKLLLKKTPEQLVQQQILSAMH